MTRTKFYVILMTLHAIGAGISFDQSKYGIMVALIVLTIFWFFAMVEIYSEDVVDDKRKKESALKATQNASN